MSRNKKNYTLEQVLDAIKGSNSIVSNVAKKLKCEWHVAERNIGSWTRTQKAFDNESESVLDFTESMLMKKIKDGDTQAIKYKLSSHGRKRGYGEKVDVGLSGKVAMPRTFKEWVEFETNGKKD